MYSHTHILSHTNTHTRTHRESQRRQGRCFKKARAKRDHSETLDSSRYPLLLLLLLLSFPLIPLLLLFLLPFLLLLFFSSLLFILHLLKLLSYALLLYHHMPFLHPSSTHTHTRIFYPLVMGTVWAAAVHRPLLHPFPGIFNRTLRCSTEQDSRHSSHRGKR